MDSTNNQIYKIAKYLNKYTKDGNKKGSMYLQKLNNYLHKVQHGGQAMQIVEQIQEMVGQVIDMHQHEREALIQKLQKFTDSKNDITLGNYDNIVLELKEKIKSVPPTGPVRQQEQPKKYSFKMKVYELGILKPLDEKGRITIFNQFKPKILKALNIEGEQISYNSIIDVVSITATKKRLFLLNRKKGIKVGENTIFLVPDIEASLSKEDDNELKKLKQLIEGNIQIFEKRSEMNAILGSDVGILRKEYEVVGYIINPKTGEFEGNEKNLKYNFSIIQDNGSLKHEYIQKLLDKIIGTNHGLKGTLKVDNGRVILEYTTAQEYYNSLNNYTNKVNYLSTGNMNLDITTKEGREKYVMLTVLTEVEIKEIINISDKDLEKNLLKIIISSKNKEELQKNINNYSENLPQEFNKDDVKTLLVQLNNDIVDIIEKEEPILKNKIEMYVVELPKNAQDDGKIVSVRLFLKGIKYDNPTTLEEEAINYYADEIEEKITKAVSPLTSNFNVVGYIVDPDTNRVVGNVDNAKFTFGKSQGTDKLQKSDLESLESLDSLVYSLDKNKSFMVTNDGFSIYYKNQQNILEVSYEFLDNEYIVELVKDIAQPKQKVYVRLFIKPMIEQTTGKKSLSPKQVAINELESVIDKKIKEEVSKKSLFDIAQEQEQAPEPKSDPNELTTTHFDIVGYVVDPKTNRVAGKIDDAKYKFPTKDRKTLAQNEPMLLQDEYVQTLLGPFKLTDKVNKDKSFKVTYAGVRIHSKERVKIREFVDPINKGEATVVQLPNTNKSQPENVFVRLFVKPMTQIPSPGKPLHINNLEKVINEEIRQAVKKEPEQQVPKAVASSKQLDSSNPTTNKFDIVGFYIDRDNNVKRYYILPENKKLVLNVLDEKYSGKVKQQQPIEMMRDKDEQEKVIPNAKARITFTDELPIRDVLRSVNIDPPKQVNFPKSGEQKHSVYMFIVPMTYPITDKTTNNKYYEAINIIQIEEMGKIRKKMQEIAMERQQSVSQQPTSRPIPRGRGASNVGRGGSRGPYRHPNEEYNL